jgi:hypothetical protein
LTFYRAYARLLAREKVQQSMSATTVRLLKAASEIVGSDQALAARLGISETLLSLFIADSRELPDPLVLRTVDIILANRQSQLPLAKSASRAISS